MQEIFDAFRHVLVLLWVWSFFPCIFSSLAAANNNEKTELEFRAYRLQQYELAGKMYGSKSWRVLYETVSINGSALRKCLIVSWRDLIDKDLDSSLGAAIGAVLVIIPEDMNALMEAERRAFLNVEEKFAGFRTDQAVYFAPNSPTLNYLLKSVSMTSKKASTALQQLYNTVAANNFQLVSANTAIANPSTTKHHNVIGQLNAAEHGRPYLFIVAHYDSHAPIPSLGKGVDSNGSGVAALFEILAILSRFYSSPQNRPKYNIMFVLSAGGKFNYQGSRQLIDNFQEKHPEAKIAFVLCLDGLGGGDALNFHVSKALTDGTAAHKFFQTLQNFAGKYQKKDDQEGYVRVVTKKISLSAERLAWEHEIYNVRRIHAATVSHFENYADPTRASLLDNHVDERALTRNVFILANAVVSFVFNLDTTQCKTESNPATVDNTDEDLAECSVIGANGVDAARLMAWLDAFGSAPRSMSAISSADNEKLISNLRSTVQRFADKTTVTEVVPVDLTFYDIFEDKLLASVVKPAIFELFLAAAIGSYLLAVFFIAQSGQTLLEQAVVMLKKVT